MTNKILNKSQTFAILSIHADTMSSLIFSTPFETIKSPTIISPQIWKFYHDGFFFLNQNQNSQNSQ